MFMYIICILVIPISNYGTELGTCVFHVARTFQGV